MIATSQMFTASALARPMEPFCGGRARPGLEPARQALPPHELVDAINRMLDARAECQGLEFETGSMVPATPDADGCNWRPHGLQLRVAHGPSTRALAGVRQVIDLARLRYALANAEDA